MGYTTNFTGRLYLSKKPTKKLQTYINTFANTRRMKRDVNILMNEHDGKYGLNKRYGVEGEFFARNDGDFGQRRDNSILDFNVPPATQPGLWAQWVLTEDGEFLEWDGNEKFYHYIEWLRYYIDNFFAPNKIKLNGVIEWQGEDRDDIGRIVVVDNVVEVQEGRIVYE